MTTEKVIFGYNDGTQTVAIDDDAYVTCTEENTLSYEPTSEARQCLGDSIDGGGKPSITGSEVAGDLTLGANYEDIGLALKSVLGDPTTVVNDLLFDHAYDTTATVLPYMWFQYKRIDGGDTLNEQYSGILTDTLELKLEAEGLNSPVLGLKGGDYLNDLLGDSITVNDESNLHTLGETDMPYVNGVIQIEIASSMTDACWLSSFVMKIDRGIDTKKLLCDAKSNTITKCDVSGTFEGEFSAVAYQAIFSKDNSKAVKTTMTFTSGDKILEFTMDEVTFNFKSEPVKYGESMMVQGDWSASKKAGSTEKMSVLLTNGVADYNL